MCCLFSPFNLIKSTASFFAGMAAGYFAVINWQQDKKFLAPPLLIAKLDIGGKSAKLGIAIGMVLALNLNNYLEEKFAFAMPRLGR